MNHHCLRRSATVAAALATILTVWPGGVPAAEPAQPDRIGEVRSGKRQEARASWWGFDPADSTRHLQDAIQSGARRLIIDRQASPWMTRPLKGVSGQEIVLESGVEIVAVKGAFRGRNDCLLVFDGCEKVTIRGVANKEGEPPVIRMWKSDYSAEPYERSEWRHGVAFRGCSDVLVESLRIEATGGDGIYLGSGADMAPNRRVVIRGVDCTDNHRQGISVISADSLLIEDCFLRNTRGTAPQAGIDFEPNDSSDVLTNCVVRNCTAFGNAGTGYQICLQSLNSKSTPVGITIEDSLSGGNGQHAIHLVSTRENPPGGRLNVARFASDEDAMCGLSVQFNPHDAVRVEVTEATFRFNARNDPFFAPIYIEGGGRAERPAGNIHLRNVVVQDNVDRPPVHIQGRDSQAPETLIRNCSGKILLRRNGQEQHLELPDAAR